MIRMRYFFFISHSSVLEHFKMVWSHSKLSVNCKGKLIYFMGTIKLFPNWLLIIMITRIIKCKLIVNYACTLHYLFCKYYFLLVTFYPFTCNFQNKLLKKKVDMVYLSNVIKLEKVHLYTDSSNLLDIFTNVTKNFQE